MQRFPLISQCSVQPPSMLSHFSLIIAITVVFFVTIASAGGFSVKRNLSEFSVDIDQPTANSTKKCAVSDNAEHRVEHFSKSNENVGSRVRRDTNYLNEYGMWMTPARRAMFKSGKQKVAISKKKSMTLGVNKRTGKLKNKKGKTRKVKGNGAGVVKKGGKIKGRKRRSKKLKRGLSDMAVSAAGNAQATSMIGDSMLHVNGKKNPSVATSGNAAAFASDGHSAVSSVKGKPSKRKPGDTSIHDISDDIMESNKNFMESIIKLNQKRIKNIMSKSPSGSSVHVGAGSGDANNFDPFKFAGLQDPRELIG